LSPMKKLQLKKLGYPSLDKDDKSRGKEHTKSFVCIIIILMISVFQNCFVKLLRALSLLYIWMKKVYYSDSVLYSPQELKSKFPFTTLFNVVNDTISWDSLKFRLQSPSLSSEEVHAQLDSFETSNHIVSFRWWVELFVLHLAWF
jgi:hypothetical protein